MKRTLVVLSLVIILAVVFGFFVAQKNIIVARLLEKGISKALGLEVAIGNLDVSIFATHLKIDGLVVYNPAGFSQRELARVSTLEIVCDPIDYIKNKKIHLYFLDLKIDRINVEKNKDGLVNLKQIKTAKAADTNLHKNQAPFMLNIFRLGLKDLNYAEYTADNKTKKRTFNIDIKDAMFSKLDDSSDILKLILLKILTNTEVGSLINMSVAPIAKDVGDVVVLAGNTVKDTIRGLVNGISTPFRILMRKPLDQKQTLQP